MTEDKLPPPFLGPLMPCYNRHDIAFERGEGVQLFDTSGRRYLDFAAGIAVNALGHAHPHLVAALQGQAAKLWHTSNMYHIPAQERLAERLVDHSFADGVFFTNSGVEAMECAIKLARRYHYATGNPGRYEVIAFHGAFHGRSLATIAAAGKEKLVEGFGPMLTGFDQVPFFDLEAARAAITDQTAAILVEPVQGEGGIVPVQPQQLKDLRALCDQHGVLLILDEIQCGMGRTGRLFAHEWAGIEPDIVASAKGIGSGFPLGACLAKAHVACHLGVGTHGSTYGGNPLAMAVGNAVMDVMLAPGFMDDVCDRADYLRAGLVRLKANYGHILRDVRGLGLMLGLEFDRPARPLITQLMQDGLLVAQSGENVIRLLPPLIITRADIDEALATLTRLLDGLLPTEETS